MKLMLLMTIKTARLHRRGGMKNDSWRVPGSAPHSSNCGDWGAQAAGCRCGRGELQVGETASKWAVWGNVTYFVSELPESGL